MDNLTKLKGVGKATAAMLAGAGVVSFADLAAADAASLVAKGGFKPSHDVAGWIAEAKDVVANGGVPTKNSVWRGVPVSIVLRRDVDGVGAKGATVTMPEEDAAELRRAGKARRMLLSDLPAN